MCYFYDFQLFCEVCENFITLTNSGFCVFECSVTCDDIPTEETPLKVGWLNVSPKSAKLHPGDSVTLNIKYFPGIVGEFTESFRVAVENNFINMYI